MSSDTIINKTLLFFSEVLAYNICQESNNVFGVFVFASSSTLVCIIYFNFFVMSNNRPHTSRTGFNAQD